MAKPLSALKVTDHVYWVGAIDWALQDFHGYLTSRGTTYNAYLVMAEKITLIDTVKAPFKDEMLSRIASIADPSRISYIVSNHSEMDHSGCLPDVIRVVKPEKVFASVIGAKTLKEHFHTDDEITAVKDGETLSLGNMTLRFFETKMLHWPDSMFTYLPDESVLFSQDGFGMHLASSERFDDEVSDEILLYEAAKYYANILLPFSPIAAKTLHKFLQLNLSVDIIAPDHGPIWRKGVKRIIDLYLKWSARAASTKAVIVYDTMWQSTAKMAMAVAEGVTAGGAQAKVMPLSARHRSDIALEMLDASALVVGSPTINNTIFPTVADVLFYLRGLKPHNLIGAAFGSYGWSGEAVGIIESMLRDMKVELVQEGVRARHVPTDEDLTPCVSLGRNIAEKLRASMKSS
ncbi:flavodoxin domain-containing protein [Candidatus Sumerlaeota bacterium]|nr:flavodoxin domain-containing protein [Candidatus Sumerlaeota bacterium]